MSGKGSTPRPLSVDATTFASNYAATFKPQHDLDGAERIRRENLAHAKRIVLSQPPASWMPSTDWPARESLPTTEPESDE